MEDPRGGIFNFVGGGRDIGQMEPRAAFKATWKVETWSHGYMAKRGESKTMEY